MHSLMEMSSPPSEVSEIIDGELSSFATRREGEYPYFD